MKFLISSLLLVLQIFYILNNEVEARRGDVIPLGSLFESVERRHLKNSDIKFETANSKEYEIAEFPEFRKRKIKPRHKKLKNKHKDHHKDKTKKYKKKNHSNKRFVKTVLKDVDSKMSGSKEIDKKLKPVDIIVHIKMND